ncbi:DUF6678 family protein [Saccharospirillum salsuginis]|uniref:Uncharacterized protein n=1 Tax=Saccharospirillum salsuginis TaxID=418750 RepID=A0A918KM07_9GAMM|nr:DUF6678 family protein [Saccharospirillum salsuginis]GGX68942.1 hypothetical protein GCM10007392_40760 [Saccharospirillum salsuginis]
MIERLKKVIEERNLVSVMNNTKWEKLANSLMDLGKDEPYVRVKDIYDEESSGFSLFDWTFSEYSPSRLEWVDISPIRKVRRGRLVADFEIDNTEIVHEAILKSQVPYSMEGNNFRVWGYFEAGTIPEFL